ncbi:MAG: peptidoglycan recognition protein family protein, partial [Anaerolineae bacterium]
MTRFIDHIDVHHSASFSDTVEGIRYYHTVIKGWGEIAYNELIDHDGNLCYGKSDENYPYSTGSWERDHTGWAICILGRFGDVVVRPTAAQWASLIRRLGEKAAEFNTHDIKGHRERWNNSACPGFSDAILNKMRAEVFAITPPIQKEDEMAGVALVHVGQDNKIYMVDFGRLTRKWIQNPDEAA